MSADEDTELRDLVAQTLESNGVLGKIRAQLRASIFLALEEQESVQNKTPYLNKQLKAFIGTKEGRLVTSLVREFLEFFRLDFTLAVFDPESGAGDIYDGRTNLARELNIIESENSRNDPLLAELLKRGSGENKTRSQLSNTLDDMSADLIEEAREKFHMYDADQSGVIEKDELRQLFCDMFPDFNKNMLDRYVNDEFKAVDKDFSNTIDFEEFLGMYKRVFVLCKSLVSQDVVDITQQSPRLMVNSKKSNQTLQNHESAKQSGQSKPATEKSMSKDTQPAKESPRELLGNSQEDDDSFFDDPVPKVNSTKATFGSSNSTSKENKASAKPSNIPKPSAMSSLAGLPALGQTESSKSPRSPDMENDIKDIDKKIADLGFELPDDDYDDDFVTSESMSPRGHTPRSDVTGQTPRTDVGVTPRTDRSDKVRTKSIEEEIEEDIDEDFSVADDILKSSQSAQDDLLTTDRTISPTDQNGGFDYMEDIVN